jgi:formylglycine-generating enzyme required for sulfatase activity
MVCVPGGTYLMGCMPYDTQCDPAELPMVEVTLSPFFIDVEEATYEEVIPFLNTLYDGYFRGQQAVYKEGEGAIYNAGWGSGGPPVGMNDAGLFEWGAIDDESTCWLRPVDAASGCFGWLGAKEYCEWRGKRLPTEAEWEAAARGQTKWIYPCAWGHLPCWYGYYDACDPDGECYLWPHLFENCCLPLEATSVGACTSPNGAKRMYGNAFEWILDRKSAGDDHSWCLEGCTDPTPREGTYPVLKGGSVGTSATTTRISNRIGGDPNGGPYTGVRCVLSPIVFSDVPDSGVDGGK